MVAPCVFGEEFFYKHEVGDKYRIVSTVNENVYFDQRLSHRAEILNRITMEVKGVEGDRAIHEAVFLSAEKATGISGGQSFQWSKEYISEFGRDKSGAIKIDDSYFMPVVRNVPVFPDRDIKEGETWSAEGTEVHDFRDSFGIGEPYRIPFKADYTFLGNLEWKDRTFPSFSVSYRVFSEPKIVNGRIWPVRIQGASDQIVYWDSELGQAAAYEESFRIIFELSSGMTVEYRGRAVGEIIEATLMDKKKLAEEIAGDIDRLGIPDTTVRIVDEGITIAMENIQFEADSAILFKTEKDKLDKIAEILAKFADRDILVGGHTALAGTAAGRMQLSVERAGSVADYLISKKVRTPERVVVRGYGAEKPLGDNSTEAGRRQNRRVEITILEN